MLYTLINRDIINRDKEEQLSAEMKRQIKLFNIAALTLIFLALSMALINIIQHGWLLVISNVVLLCFAIPIFLIKRIKHYNITLYILVVILSFYMFFNALLFHNSLQYGLMSLMAFTVMAVEKNTPRLSIIILQALLLVTFIGFQNRLAIVNPLPTYRQCLIVACILFVFISQLGYFKHRQLNYRKNLAALNEELQQSNDTRQRMLSILSHDFNSPVRNLGASLQMLDENDLTKEQFGQVSATLQAQLQVLATSLEDVLEWSQMQMHGSVLPEPDVNIYGLFVEITPLFQFALKEKRLTLHNGIDATIKGYVYANHLKTVFRNLLSNAIKFSKKGGNIYLTASTDGQQVTINVIDEGTGMPPQTLAALQNEQLNITSMLGTEKEKGTGLGLMIVREFLQKNNGQLTIESKLGEGSTFSVVLPVK